MYKCYCNQCQLPIILDSNLIELNSLFDCGNIIATDFPLHKNQLN